SGIELRRLVRREEAKRALSEPRIHPERLERRPDAVTAERRAEPGNPRVRIRAVLRLRREQAQIGLRSIEPVVELLVRREDLALALLLFPRARRRLRENGFVGRRRGDLPLAPMAGDPEIQDARLPALEAHPEVRGAALDALRRGDELEARLAHDVVEAAVGEDDRGTAHLRRQGFPTPLPPCPAHLE